MRTRCTARVIAINKDKRVLLFKYEDAAKRELFEESGLVPIALSKCIWNRVVELNWKEELIQFQEQYYMTYVEEVDIKLDNLTLEEREVYRSYKWWSVEEICHSNEIFFPPMLGALLKPIVSGDLPLEPLNIN